MFLVWVNDIPRKTAFKCHELPMDGNGKAIKYISKHELTKDEEAMPIRYLEGRYPIGSVKS